jgi:hypothetical protein
VHVSTTKKRPGGPLFLALFEPQGLGFLDLDPRACPASSALMFLNSAERSSPGSAPNE